MTGSGAVDCRLQASLVGHSGVRCAPRKRPLMARRSDRQLRVGSTHCRLTASGPRSLSDRFRAVSSGSGPTQPDPQPPLSFVQNGHSRQADRRCITLSDCPRYPRSIPRARYRPVDIGHRSRAVAQRLLDCRASKILVTGSRNPHRMQADRAMR
jgi:hypothetical protein